MSLSLQPSFLTGILIASALHGADTTRSVQENIKLQMIPVVEAPIIEKKVLRLNIDFVFNRCPQEYWIHYSRESGRLVIEFIGFHIDAPPLVIKGTSVVSDLEVSNKESDIALNKKASEVSMTMQEGWHYESWIITGKILRLQLWMPLNPNRILKKKKNRYTLPIVLTVVGLAAITYLLMAAPWNSN